MRGGGNETDHVQKGAAAHADHEFVAVNAHFHQPVLQAGDQRGVVFHLLATCHHFGTADQFKRIGVNLGIRGYVVDQGRPACRDVGIHEHREAMALGGFTAHHRLQKYRIVAGEHMLGEMHRVVIADREFLVVDRPGIGRCLDQFDAHVFSRPPVCCYLKTVSLLCSGTAAGSPTRGAWPRKTELPSNNMRWSIGSGSSQCSSFIWPLWPNALSALP